MNKQDLQLKKIIQAHHYDTGKLFIEIKRHIILNYSPKSKETVRYKKPRNVKVKITDINGSTEILDFTKAYKHLMCSEVTLRRAISTGEKIHNSYTVKYV